MYENLGLDGAWLTVNRACNFRCKWCYADDIGFGADDCMSLEFACHLVDFCKKIKIKNIILIGGEPTVWKPLIPLIRHIKNREMTASIVTNGFKFHQQKFVEEILASGVDSVNFSLKTGNSAQHLELTKTDTFEGVMKAIRNISSAGIDVVFTIVISSLVMDNLIEIIKMASDNGAKNISLQFCSPTFIGTMPKKDFMIEPKEIARTISSKYEKLCVAAGYEIFIEQSLPNCLWPADFLADLKRRNQISFGCFVMSRNGIVFDTHGNVIPCNCLLNAKLGRYGRDFSDIDTFEAFWNNESTKDFYRQLTSYPSMKCISCSEFESCAGGCPLQWFVYEPDEVISGRTLTPEGGVK